MASMLICICDSAVALAQESTATGYSAIIILFGVFSCGARESLPELFGDEGHERVEKSQTSVEANPKRISQLFLRDFIRSSHNRLDDLDVNRHRVRIARTRTQSSWRC